MIRPMEHRDQRMASERHAMEISKPDLYQEAIDRLVTLLGEARRLECNEPNAMTLATCDRNRRPTARTVSRGGLRKLDTRLSGLAARQ